MKKSSDNQQKWIRIIGNHCNLYYPSLQTLKSVYKLHVEVILDKGLQTEKAIEWFYLCPLCLKNYVFLDGDIISGTESFDNDHYPPKSVGGKKTVLVCKSCNSNYGAKFDYAIEQYLNFQAFLKKKKSTLKSKISLNNTKGKYSGNLNWEENILVQNINLKKYPLLIEGLKKAASSPENMNIKFSLLIPGGTIVQKSFLKAAYLYCFALWGYEFTYSHIGRNIIKVLNDQAIHPLTNLGVFKEESSKPLSEGLYFIESPSNYKCFMYTCKGVLKKQDEFSNTFVLIPKLSPTSWEDFKAFQDLIPSGELTFSMSKIDAYGVYIKEYLGYSKISSML